MQINEFEASRIAEGTLRHGAQHVSFVPAGVADIPPDDIVPADPGPTHFSPTDTNNGRLNKPRKRHVLGATTLTGDRVRNGAGDDLGKIEEIMLDLHSGRVAYAVLSFGGFLGIGDKLFVVPWNVLRLDQVAHEFVLNVPKQVLETAPGFDRNNWPDLTNPDYAQGIHSHYGLNIDFGGDISSPGRD